MRKRSAINQRKANRNYYEKNKEAVKAAVRAKRAANKDEINKKRRDRYLHDEEYRNYCRNRELNRNYGISLEFYNYMLTQQDHKCAICKSAEFGRKTAQSFAVDHDHKTNQVRGLLCHKCNSMLGSANDDIGSLKEAILYLEKARILLK